MSQVNKPLFYNYIACMQLRYHSKVTLHSFTNFCRGLYKILTDLVQVNHSDFSSVTRGHSLHLLHLPTTVDVYSYSLLPLLHQNLPEDVVISPSLDLFKLKLYNHYMYVNTPFWGSVH